MMLYSTTICRSGGGCQSKLVEHEGGNDGTIEGPIMIKIKLNLPQSNN